MTRNGTQADALPRRQRVGVVAIGRNEGARLGACLAAAVPQARVVVYVDSGSTDGSVRLAESLGARVVELCETRPFSAARSRNAGFRELRRVQPDLEFVQFVDGDSELERGWIERGARAFAGDDSLAIVCGRLAERHPERSLYNRLCELEWAGPTGEIDRCGGNQMIRAGAFDAVGGFDERLPAGEEPELCLRLRRLGMRIVRIDAPMARHDAAMTSFRQWWTRSVRGGYAAAMGAWLHGRERERFNVRRILSIVGWALVAPSVAAILSWTLPWGILSWTVFPIQWARLAARNRRRGLPTDLALLEPAATIVGKFAQLQGVLTFGGCILRGRGSRAIEQGGAGPGGPPSVAGGA